MQRAGYMRPDHLIIWFIHVSYFPSLIHPTRSCAVASMLGTGEFCASRVRAKTSARSSNTHISSMWSKTSHHPSLETICPARSWADTRSHPWPNGSSLHVDHSLPNLFGDGEWSMSDCCFLRGFSSLSSRMNETRHGPADNNEQQGVRELTNAGAFLATHVPSSKHNTHAQENCYTTHFHPTELSPGIDPPCQDRPPCKLLLGGMCEYATFAVQDMRVSTMCTTVHMGLQWSNNGSQLACYRLMERSDVKTLICPHVRSAQDAYKLGRAATSSTPPALPTPPASTNHEAFRRPFPRPRRDLCRVGHGFLADLPGRHPRWRVCHHQRLLE
jgi:hypothetical protein